MECLTADIGAVNHDSAAHSHCYADVTLSIQTVGSMNSRKTYTAEQIQALSDILGALKLRPKPPRPVTTSGAVALLIKDIQALQARGYTIQEIADLLRDNALPVSAATLKSAMARAQEARRKKSPAKKTASGGRVAANAAAPHLNTTSIPGNSAPDAREDFFPFSDPNPI